VHEKNVQRLLQKLLSKNNNSLQFVSLGFSFSFVLVINLATRNLLIKYLNANKHKQTFLKKYNEYKKYNTYTEEKFLVNLRDAFSNAFFEIFSFFYHQV